MAKVKTTFFCQNCGAQSPKWVGKCSSCGEWNTYVEEVVQKPTKNDAGWENISTSKRTNSSKPISEVVYDERERITTNDNELNRVLGGGIVPGSLVLIGGEPGIGKSTLMLQLALSIGQKVVYVSGEESEQQLKMRADRIGMQKSSNCHVLAETSLTNVFHDFVNTAPDVVIIDSIQTIFTNEIESAAGSISQVRECTAQLMKFAKQSGTPVFLVGHITKEGTLAGPKVLEHMVDTVLQFEGDRHLTYRILRTTKNRFGSTSELGIYEMLSSGLREVSNPSEILISQKDEDISGVTIAATIEGNRPLMIELQALVSPATYGNPQRSATGFDLKRLNMILAVLEKRYGLKLSTQDVFLNVAGGIKVIDPALDLAVCLSIFSSYEEINIPSSVCFAAEVGLGGEVRAISRIENRISEAEKLGFSQIFVSRNNMKGLDISGFKIEITPVGKLSDVFGNLFG